MHDANTEKYIDTKHSMLVSSPITVGLYRANHYHAYSNKSVAKIVAKCQFSVDREKQRTASSKIPQMMTNNSKNYESQYMEAIQKSKLATFYHLNPKTKAILEKAARSSVFEGAILAPQPEFNH